MIYQSVCITGPSGVGKSTFARSAIAYEGSGLVIAAPGNDELDSYIGLSNCEMAWFDDLGANGLGELRTFLRAKLELAVAAYKEKKEPPFKVAVMDTISGVGHLAMTQTLRKFNRDSPPPAQSPDGAAFYGYIRNLQEEVISYFRAFKGYNIHIIGLTHIGEGEVTDANVAKDVEGKIKVFTPLVPGSFKTVLPARFSTVLSAGIGRDKEGKRVHYLQWKADGKRMTKSRLGDLSDKPYIPVTPNDGWPLVKAAVEEAAAKRFSANSA